MAVSIQTKSLPPAASFFSWLIWGQLGDLGLAFMASLPLPWPWEGVIVGAGVPSTVQDGEQRLTGVSWVVRIQIGAGIHSIYKKALKKMEGGREINYVMYLDTFR